MQKQRERMPDTENKGNRNGPEQRREPDQNMMLNKHISLKEKMDQMDRRKLSISQTIQGKFS